MTRRPSAARLRAIPHPVSLRYTVLPSSSSHLALHVESEAQTPRAPPSPRRRLACGESADASGFPSQTPGHLQISSLAIGVRSPGPASAHNAVLVDQEKGLRRSDAVLGHLHALPR